MKLFGRFLSGVALLVGAAGAGAGIALIPIASSPAGAATTLVVNDALDGTATPGNCTTSTPTTGPDCTFRAALMEAATESGSVVVSLPNPNDVEFNSGLVYQVLSLLTVTALNSSSSVTVSGVGASTSVIQAQCTGVSCTVNFGVFEISSGTTAAISGVTIEDGKASTGAASGGGIWNDGGTLTLQSSTLTNDVANGGSGGGLWNEGTATVATSTFTNNSTGNDGAAILNQGILTATGSTFVGNTSGGRGGAIDQEEASAPAMTLTNDVVSDNSSGGDGGGIYVNGGSITLSGGTIGGTGATAPADLGNSTSSGCGGGLAIQNATGTSSGVTYGGSDTAAGNTASSCGGGVYVSGGTTSFTGDSISDNTSNGSGGGGGVVIGSGTNSFSGTAVTGNTSAHSWNGGGFDIQGGTNTFGNDAINNNVATSDGWGGGVYESGGTQTFTGGTLSDNLSYYGGGIFISSGTTTMTQLTVAGNTASEAGGGVVVNDATTAITTTITDSTINGNTAAGSVGFTALLGDGGGILDSFCNTLVLTNDTIVNNLAGGSGRGGGYEAEGCGTAGSPNTTFLFDTVADNSTGKSTGGGNIQLSDSSTVTLADTIVAGGIVSGNAGANCAIDSGALGTITSLGYNLIGDSTCGTAAATDVIGKDPQLGSLANNGGPTATLLPAGNAPEVGAIPQGTCVGTGVGTDQRGVARGAGAHSSCTIGAVEVGQNF
ncbi:MAG TPA: choice-of-anchor Q domain-containing protein, partial [Acidimicrobiales bacterium]|nr:choice-of-anchor Q domain-containing protein [Acidimicrobiales bacterium]